MNIAILTFGSRGDIQPYVALGKGLQQAGHSVRLLTHVEFESFIRGHGLDFFPIHVNPKELLEGETAQHMLESGTNPLAFLSTFKRFVADMLHTLLKECPEGCQGADFIIWSVMGWLAAPHVMEKTGIPGYAAYLQPISPTREFPAPPYPLLPLGGVYNLSSYYFNQEISWLALRGAGNAARKDVLGLPSLPMSSPFPRLHREQVPILCGFSEHVVPKPRDWYDALTLTGYWFLDTQNGWTPPSALMDFLHGGPPPVYIGFGSMHSRDAEAVTRLAVQALDLSDQRGILLTGWGGLASMDIPKTVHVIESAPHDWLFPRMKAVIHHCGAGTTAAGVRAGVPTIGVPFFADQPFWAEMVYRRGAGTKPIPRKKLTAERLADAIRIAVSNESLRARAADLGEKVRREDGVDKAVEILGAYFARH